MTREIVNKIFKCKNMSNEIEILQIRLHVTQQGATEANKRLDQILARVSDPDVARLEAGSQFLDGPVFDSR